MESTTCIECNERPVFIKKRKLCRLCYMRLYMQGKLRGKTGHTKAEKNLATRKVAIATEKLIDLQDLGFEDDTTSEILEMLNSLQYQKDEKKDEKEESDNAV